MAPPFVLKRKMDAEHPCRKIRPAELEHCQAEEVRAALGMYGLPRRA